ncbi:uncharacterized protein si:ch211-158d24.4 [Tachysurus vachellii]|uniref:uncharacterized protein si:ch211-158d24.4 n=1 Tax=Tachysurus vachellii TaxID=175792 RepID=UPI00296AEC33|nr:uncharacterized protein si:ch211-158d24.4 [Tachysurus vachellii]
MELKDSCPEGRESYTIFMETDAILRNQRSLRRELCISRMLIFILLIVCTVSSVIRCIQQIPNGKNNDIMNKEKANETFASFISTSEDVNSADVQTPLTAFLKIAGCPNLTRPWLTWTPYSQRFSNFTLIDDGETLVMPHSGWYHFNLQITYAGKENNPMERQINLSHNIFKYSDSYNWKPVIINTVYETVYSEKHWAKSVSSEVSHVLKKGDKVKVLSRNVPLIDCGGDPWTRNFLVVSFVSEIREL